MDIIGKKLDELEFFKGEYKGNPFKAFVYEKRPNINDVFWKGAISFYAECECEYRKARDFLESDRYKKFEKIQES